MHDCLQFGDVSFADRAEVIAFNALPATWASPKGGDMWAHQYLQAVNEINAIKADPHVWAHDGDMAETYGLEPNFGCCTANFNQGWPKFANMAILQAPGNGAAVTLYSPASAVLPDGSVVDVGGAYPFDDEATVTVTAKGDVPLHLRIPVWASKATVSVNGAAGQPARNGTMFTVKCAAGQTTTAKVSFNPEIRMESWTRTDPAGDDSQGTVWSVHRGALMYSLPIGANYTRTAHHFGSYDQSSDYELRTDENWAYALVADPANPDANLKFVKGGYEDGSAPFNHTAWPTHIVATVRGVPGWGEDQNSAAAPPVSPACADDSKCGPPIQVMLVPHGGTDLRMGELPLATM